MGADIIGFAVETTENLGQSFQNTYNSTLRTAYTGDYSLFSNIRNINYHIYFLLIASAMKFGL